jgi:hypothetical protein
VSPHRARASRDQRLDVVASSGARSSATLVALHQIGLYCRGLRSSLLRNLSARQQALQPSSHVADHLLAISRVCVDKALDILGREMRRPRRTLRQLHDLTRLIDRGSSDDTPNRLPFAVVFERGDDIFCSTFSRSAEATHLEPLASQTRRDRRGLDRRCLPAAACRASQLAAAENERPSQDRKHDGANAN